MPAILPPQAKRAGVTPKQILDSFSETLMQDERILSARERELLLNLLRHAENAGGEGVDNQQNVRAVIASAVGETVAKRAFAVLGGSIVERILESGPVRRLILRRHRNSRRFRIARHGRHWRAGRLRVLSSNIYLGVLGLGRCRKRAPLRNPEPPSQPLRNPEPPGVPLRNPEPPGHAHSTALISESVMVRQRPAALAAQCVILTNYRAGTAA